MSYNQEAIGPVLSGVVTVGSVAGYDGGKEYSLAETQDIVDKINMEFDGSVWPSIPCMIREEHLVGRASASKYREKLYKMNFLWSPRAKAISNNTFLEGLCEYGFRLGKEMQQKRVYIDYKDKTFVFKESPTLEEGEFVSVNSELELSKIASSYLTKGRPDWDLPHTLETVNWMNKLVDAEGGNRHILLSTMWLHDIGYSGLFDGITCNYDSINNAKEFHMKRGAELSKSILTKLNYQENEIERISQLVGIHDKAEQLESPYEIMVMEADTLGQLSQSQIKSSFSTEENARFIQYVLNERKPIFRTKTGKRFLEELLAKAK